MTLTEHALLIREGKKIVEALGAMFAPLVEVVLHDLTQPDHAIVAIANNISGRKIGDASTEMGFTRINHPNFPQIIQNYPNRFNDGRSAKSTSIGLKNSKGEYVAAICLNMDISFLNSVAASLLNLTATGPPSPIDENLAPCHITDIQKIIEKAAAKQNTTPRHLSLESRKIIVADLVEKGVLDIKHGLAEIAKIFGVARSTIYTYLP